MEELVYFEYIERGDKCCLTFDLNQIAEAMLKTWDNEIALQLRMSDERYKEIHFCHNLSIRDVKKIRPEVYNKVVGDEEARVSLVTVMAICALHDRIVQHMRTRCSVGFVAEDFLASIPKQRRSLLDPRWGDDF